jgi:carboxypeptidase family protein
VAHTPERRDAFRSYFGVLLLAVIGVVPVTTAAQGGAILEGVATDDSGAPIPGVTITATHRATGVSRATQTTGDGTFSIEPLLADGEYIVRAERRGFITAIREGVVVATGEISRVDFRLKLSASEVVAVSGSAISLVGDSLTTTQVQTIDERLVEALPLSGREFVELTTLAPGFTGNPDFPSSQGQSYWTNNVLVDGSSSFSKWRGTARGFYSGYALESIEQVSVLTNTFSAEVGDALASVTAVVTRSGTDSWRGSALLFARGSGLDGRPAFASRRPAADAQQFGGSLGGPIVVGRSHMFASYEGHRSRGRNIVTSSAAPNVDVPDNQDEHLAFLRVDHQASNRHIVTGRYNGQFLRWHYEPGGLTLPGSGTQFTNTAHTLLATDRLQISGRLLNDLRAQFAHFVDMRRDVQPSVFVSRAGYSTEGGTLGPFGFGTNPERTFEAADTVSYWIASHALQIGGSTRLVAAHDPQLPFGRGAYFFAGSPTVFATPFAYMQTIALDPESATADPHSTAVSAFVQDDWRLHRSMSIHAGVRYDVERLSNIRNYTAATDTNNIQPRGGVAWDLRGDGATIVRGGVGMYTQQHLLSAVERVETGGPDGAIAISLTPESPLFPTFPTALARLPSNLAIWPPRDLYRVEPSLGNPYSIQTSVGVQQLLFKSAVTVNYVTLTGRDLLSLVDVNAPASIAKPAQRTVAAADATRPLEPGPGTYRKIITLGNEGRSWYRALQVKVARSTTTTQLMGSYTWGRARDKANYQLPEDSRNLAAEEARASTDVRHNVGAAFTWQPAASRTLWRNWTFATLTVLRSDRPYTILWGDDRNGTTQNDARPDGRNTGKTGPYRTVDLGIGRMFRRGETSTEVRVEAFNAFNTTNYDQYVGELLSPLFGRPTSAFPPRRVQLALIVRFR